MSSTILNDIVRDYESIAAAWFTALVPDRPSRLLDPRGHRARLVGDLVGDRPRGRPDRRHRASCARSWRWASSTRCC